MFFSLRSSLILAFAATLPAGAQTTPVKDDAPPNAEVLNQQMKNFAKTREKRKLEFLDRTRQQIMKPIQSSGAAGNFVLECMRQIQFEGKDGGNAEFADWKKQNRALYSDRNLERASMIYLQYLALTLRRATLDSAEPLQADLWKYLELLDASKDLIANVKRDNNRIKMMIYDPKEDKVTGEIQGDIQDTKLASAANAGTFVQDLLNQPVGSGMVAQAFKLTDHLQRIPSWALVPGDFSGIMESNVREYLREKKDPRLLATWDTEIAFTAGVVKLKNNDQETEKFRRETYPKLIWKKAADAELLGMKNRALNIRIDLAQRYPEHPEFEAWTKIIEADLASRADVEKADAEEVEVGGTSGQSGDAEKADPSPFGESRNPAPTP